VSQNINMTKPCRLDPLSHCAIINPSTFNPSTDQSLRTMATPTITGTTLLLDMDGVMAEVSGSYRAAIVATCHHYGATSITYGTIADWKARGGCNNDWVLSLDLIKTDPNGAKDITLAEVTGTFEDFYQGTATTKGLWELETLIPTLETMQQLRKRTTGMAVVTGRPRADCSKFLKHFNLEAFFDACVCMEDGPAKPNPFPVLRACELLGVTPSTSVIMVGDTPDDIRAAVAAGCTGVGVALPEAVEACRAQGKSHDETQLALAMKACGAVVVLEPGYAKLVEMFPEQQ
jgi:HAD superfamily hydrolase (TIGR01548 family)